MEILNEKIITINEKTEKEYYGFVYITKHISKDKYYIGKKNFNKNWRNYLGSGKYLKRAIKVYGSEDFERYIVALTHTEEESCKIEKGLIDKYNASKDPKFYNIHEGGEGGYTLAGYSKEQKEHYRNKMSNIIRKKIKEDKTYIQKISEGVRRVQATPEYKENLSKGQRKRYEKEEERIKIGLASKKVWENSTEIQKQARIKGLLEYNKNEETRKILSERWQGKNNPKFGTTMSEETKQMLAKARQDKCSKAIYMYDKEWNFIKKFPTRQSVKDFLNIKGHTALLKHMRNGTMYKGYYWSEKLLSESQTTIESVSKEKDFRE